MPVTVTSSQVNPVKSLHAGPNVVRSRYIGSISTSDAILMVQVPNRATIIDWKLMGGNAGAASTGTYLVGITPAAVDAIRSITASQDAFHAGLSLTSGGLGGAFMVTGSGSVSASIVILSFAARTIPFKVSVSDDAANQFVWCAVTLSAGSQTGTHSLDMILTYLVGE